MSPPTSHDQIDAAHLAGQGGQIPHPGAMIRTTALRQVGGYRGPEFEPAEDVDLWLRLAEIARLANLPEVVIDYRVHLRSVSHVRGARQVQMSWRAVAQARSRRGLPPADSSGGFTPPGSHEIQVSQLWAGNAYAGGYYPTARKYAKRVVRAKPLSLAAWCHLGRASLGSWGRPLFRFIRRFRKRNTLEQFGTLS